MSESSRKGSSSLGPADFIDSGYYGDPFGFFSDQQSREEFRRRWDFNDFNNKARKGSGDEAESTNSTDAQADDDNDTYMEIETETEIGTETEIETTSASKTDEGKGKGKERADPQLYDIDEDCLPLDEDYRPPTPQTPRTASSRGTSLMEELEIDLETDRTWLLYPSPDALREVRDVPEAYQGAIQEVITESLRNLIAKASEEQQRVHEEEEASRRRKEEEALSAGETRKLSIDGEPYLPIIVVESEAEREEEKAEPDTPTIKDDSESTRSRSSSELMGRGLIVLPLGKPRKHRYSLSKLFHRTGSEKGESSATGAARNVLRTIYHNKGGSRSSLEESAKHDSHKAKSVIKAIIQVKLAEAREAIEEAADSKGKGKAKEEPEELMECVSCLDDFQPKEMIKAPCHSYCTDCFARLITTSLQHEQQWPPKCCLNNIPTHTIFRNVTTELRQLYNSRAEEWNIPVGQRIYCSDPNCSLFIKPSGINKAEKKARCESGHETCAICREPDHGGQDCPRDLDLERTNELAVEEGWKRCYACQALVEHREACQHMTCRCGAEFCYVCTRRWRTCTCTMEQLARLKREADARRQARLEREQEEELETQRALREVEEFQREEARKEELRRQDAIRLERERRQKELEEKVRLESLRQEAVKVKFRELHLILATLDSLQEGLIATWGENAIKELEEERESALAELARAHQAERAQIEARATIRIAEERSERHAEFAARVEDEQNLEEEYLGQLKEHYRDCKDAEYVEAQIEAAMHRCRAANDDYYVRWEKYRNKSIEQTEYAAKEEMGIKLELLENERRRREEGFAAREEGLEKQAKAGKKWLAATFAERVRLLHEKERDELENGGEDLSSYITEEDERTFLEDEEGESSMIGIAS